MLDNTCNGCKFFVDRPEFEKGTCHRRAPVYRTPGTDHPSMHSATWPTVVLSDSCGDWERDDGGAMECDHNYATVMFQMRADASTSNLEIECANDDCKADLSSEWDEALRNAGLR